VSVVDVFQIISAVATVATAGAAFAALKQWRKQIAGASDHELAKKLSAALRQVAIARVPTLRDLTWLTLEGVDGEVAKALASESLPHAASQLHAAIAALAALEGQVAVQWGDEMLALVEAIRVESSSLASYAEACADPARRNAFMTMLLSSPRDVAPTFTSGTYEKALNLLTKLAHDWLAVHVGREGAKAMSRQDLKARRKRVDDEIARLAEPERLAIAKRAADRAAEREQAALDRVIAAGGPEAYVRQLREQLDAEQRTDDEASKQLPEPEPPDTSSV
jgi:hypothetical protein